MKKILAMLVLIILLAGGAYFFTHRNPTTPLFSTGTGGAGGEQNPLMADLMAPRTATDYYNDNNQLKVTAGSVTVKRAGGTLETITAETAVSAGDTITVDDASAATVYWFDGSLSRLKAGTTLTIDKADFNPNKISETHVDLNVVKGEVWSKVINLVDKDSEFFSYSGTVVAGVRGSTLDFSVNDDEVDAESVEHSALVGVRDENTHEIVQTQVLVKGQKTKASKKQTGQTHSMKGFDIGDIPTDEASGDWMTHNRQSDDADTAALAARNLERLRRMAGTLPGEPGYDEKNQYIIRLMDSTTDPAMLARLQARLAEMRIQEALVLSSEPPASLGHLSNVMTDENGRITSYDYQDSAGQVHTVQVQYGSDSTITGYLLDHVKVMDRGMEPVVLEHPGMNGFRQNLMDTELGLTPDQLEKKRLRDKFSERNLYMLDDMTHKYGADSPETQGVLKHYKDLLKNTPADQMAPDELRIHTEILRELNNNNNNQFQQDELNTEFHLVGPSEIINNVTPNQDTKPPIRKVTPPKPSTEPKEVIDKLAPFRKGPSNR